jgi:exodeoxyribonuclease VIII
MVMENVEFVKDTFEEYLSKKDHISASDIKSFLTSPKKYYYEKYLKQYKEEKGRHFSIGSAIHEIILEPHLFETNYIIAPKFDLRTTVGKEAKAKFDEISNGKTLLFEDEVEMISQIAENALKNHSLIELMKDSYREVSCYTVDQQTGLKIRLRPDILCTSKSTIGDLKSCLDSSLKGFKSDVYKYGYSISASFYSDFLGRENYVFVAASKTAPYEVAVYALSDDMLQYGRDQYRMGLDLLKFCQDNDFWPSHNEFEVLKDCYLLGSLDTYLETLKNSELITIIQ